MIPTTVSKGAPEAGSARIRCGGQGGRSGRASSSTLASHTDERGREVPPERGRLRIAVVEDEPFSRQHLVELLEEQPGVQVVGQGENGRQGLHLAAELKPDALFLDIEMPGIRGTELLQLLPTPRPAVVFVTAHAEHAIEAFAGGAVHYLLKPVSRLGVAQALSRLRPRNDPNQKTWLRVPVRRRHGTRLLDPTEIDALVADLGDCSAWTAEGALPVEGSLSHWEERLGEHGFLRIHRNALVRLGAVKELSAEEEVVLSSGRIPVSRRRMEELKRALGV